MASLDDLAPSVAALPAGRQRRAARTSAVDEWVRGLAPAAMELGACVVAVGGYGRGDLAPGSDLDILLLVPDSADSASVAQAADALWYPVWDAGVRLDHSVRTLAQAREAARTDVRVTLGLLDARTVCGDDTLRAELASRVWAEWRQDAAARIAQLRAMDTDRGSRHGDLAHAIEPDIKESAGGLRDVAVLRALAATSLGDVQWPGVRDAAEHLLDVRDALHTVTGRSADLLARQDQQAVAEAMGMSTDDDLLRSVFRAGRVIGHSADLTWRQVADQAARRGRVAPWGRSRRPQRTPLAEGVVLQDGEAMLARTADPAADPVLVLRAAAAAAQAGAVLHPATAAALVATPTTMPVPWPEAAREALVTLLGAGEAAIPVWEALDQGDVWSQLIPEWDQVRSAPQHNPVHVWSVDRHLVQTAVCAADAVRNVDRPDLLLVSALLHDIGKGQPGDHSEAGAAMVERIAAHMGFPPDDVGVMVALTRHHLLLPETAVRRDPDDPATVTAVAAHIPDEPFLRLLHALTVADARAAGPVAASPWRLGLIDTLVRRVEQHVAGLPATPQPDLVVAPGAGRDVAVALDAATHPAQLTVTAPDFPGQLAAVAGVLALHRLGVRTARTRTHDGVAVSMWGVTPLFGDMPDPARLAQDIRLAAAGRLDVAAALATRDSLGIAAPAPKVRTVPDASARATVVEVRAHDAPGLLYRIAAAITAAGCDVTAARVATMGAEALDVFYLVDPATGGALDDEARQRVEAGVVLALTGSS